MKILILLRDIFITLKGVSHPNSIAMDLTCEWRKLAFANYIVSPEIVEKHLPPNTQIDYFNGNCFVSLVGFQFKNVEIGGVKVPFHTNFEEINLRFYVKRFDGNSWRHGTVFISEITDKATLTVLANSIFHENYRSMPTKHTEKEDTEHLEFGYYWKFKDDWQHLEVHTEKFARPVEPKSQTEFLIHRLWGYGRHSKTETNEYSISHPVWQVYDVINHDIKVDFTMLYGSEFSALSKTRPHSVILAEGSEVKVNGRKKLS